uniref:Kazal-like domain-containing protein n=1 Tax=Poecilia latipinna TaxID=48699 RepID=A0A3B3V987_9TELE
VQLLVSSVAAFLEVSLWLILCNVWFLYVYEATCPDPKIFACTFNVIPVCGSNGQSYGNECLLCKEIETNKEILVAKDGMC